MHGATALAAVLAVLCCFLSSAPVAAKDGCSKDWMRYMVLSACGMDKRDLQRKKHAISHKVESLLSEVMQEMDRRMGLTAEEEEDPDPELEEVVPPTPAAPVAMDKIRWKRLIDSPVELLEEWMGLRGSGGRALDVSNKFPRRRAIQNMISRCCSDECSAEDFEGIC